MAINLNTGGVGLPYGTVVPLPVNPPGRKSASTGQVRFSGEGLVMRFSPIAGETPRSALDRKIYLPAVLNNFTVEETALHNEFDTLSAGQFSTPAMGPASARQLRGLTVDSLICLFDPPWIVASGQDPWVLQTKLLEVLRSRKPVRAMVFRRPHELAHHDLDCNVTFRRVTREVRPGEADTNYMTVEVKEWRNQQLSRRSHSPTSRQRGANLPTTHNLKATDTLESLSKQFYGSAKYWRDIRDANHIPHRFGQKTPIVTLGGHFKAGAKVKIPQVFWVSVPGDPVTKRAAAKPGVGGVGLHG